MKCLAQAFCPKERPEPEDDVGTSASSLDMREAHELKPPRLLNLIQSSRPCFCRGFSESRGRSRLLCYGLTNCYALAKLVGIIGGLNGLETKALASEGIGEDRSCQ